MHKIVYNADYGGFRLPEFCIGYMIARGDSHSPDDWQYWRYDVERHNPTLVEFVEKYGKEHNPTLEVATIEGDTYIIEEYDGLETVVEPKDIQWIKIKADDNTGPEQNGLEKASDDSTGW